MILEMLFELDENGQLRESEADKEQLNERTVFVVTFYLHVIVCKCGLLCTSRSYHTGKTNTSYLHSQGSRVSSLFVMDTCWSHHSHTLDLPHHRTHNYSHPIWIFLRSRREFSSTIQKLTQMDTSRHPCSFITV